MTLYEEEINYQKIIDEGVKVRRNVVLKQSELTEKIYRLRGHCGHIEFRIDLTDKDREILEPFLKECPLSLGRNSTKKPIDYGTIEYVKASPKPGASFLERVSAFLFATKIPTKVQADYIICDFLYELDDVATERYRKPENSGSEFYNKTFINTYLNISFKSKLYPDEKCQFGEVDVFNPFHFDTCFCVGNDWVPRCIQWPTKENTCFWVWFINKAKAIKEGEKNEYERLFAEWSNEQEKEQVEMNRIIELAKTL